VTPVKTATVDDDVAPAGWSTAEVAGATAKQIRGSSVLLVGRVLAMVLSGATQVLIVRYLTKSDFGAFAYAIAVAALCHRLLSIGHGQVIVRFLSLYEENRDYDKLFGALAMVAGLIVSAGVMLLIGAALLRHRLTGWLIDDPRVMTLVLIVLLLGVTDALDDLLEGALAVLSRPRSIFFRKYLLNPGVLLLITVAVMVTGSDVNVLAVGFLVTGVAGVGVYAALLARTLRSLGISQHFKASTMRMPFREVFGFGLPLVTTEFLTISTYSVSVMILGAFGGTKDVAGFRAVLPVAQLNQLVIYTFTMLFVPLASRLYARGDLPAMRTAYWQTAVWLAILSFPVFALTAPLAHAVAIGLFGARYASSAAPLAVLSVGFYCTAALGFNTATLIACGRRRRLLAVNIVCTVVNVVLNFALIPHWGALGLAIASCATVVLLNVLNQLGLRAAAGIRFFEWHYARVYAWVGLATVGLWAVERALHPGLLVALVLAAGASLAVLVVNRGTLQSNEVFPELARVPLIGRLLG